MAINKEAPIVLPFSAIMKPSGELTETPVVEKVATEKGH